MSNLRFAFRQLFKSPGFAFTAVLTLALGIGANTAIFSVINSVLLRPLPYPRSDQLLVAWDNNPEKALIIPRFLRRNWPTCERRRAVSRVLPAIISTTKISSCLTRPSRSPPP